MVISKEQARVIAEKMCEKKKAEYLKAKEAAAILRVSVRTLENYIKAGDKAKKEYEDLRQEIKVALLSLRTYKRITETFPEAAKHLPNPVTYLPPAIPIETIMKKLKGK